MAEEKNIINPQNTNQDEIILSEDISEAASDFAQHSDDTDALGAEEAIDNLEEANEETATEKKKRKRFKLVKPEI